MFEDIAERAGAVAQSRLLGAGKLSRQPHARRSAFLAAHDSDPFNRWQAVQTLATALLVDNVAAIRAGGAAARRRGPARRARPPILGDAALEPAFVALALTLPSEADIAREIGRDVDPDAIFAARTRAARARSGAHLRRALRDAYRSLRGRRALSARTPPAPAAARCATPASICWPRTEPRRDRAGARGNTAAPTT